jgi:hypothetical protein
MSDLRYVYCFLSSDHLRMNSPWATMTSSRKADPPLFAPFRTMNRQLLRSVVGIFMGKDNSRVLIVQFVRQWTEFAAVLWHSVGAAV